MKQRSRPDLKDHGDGRRLWVVSELYYPEETSTGYFLTAIAEGLADEFDVHAVCGQPTYSKAGTIAPSRDMKSGVQIYRMTGTRFAKDRLLLRLINVMTLSLATLIFMLRHVRHGDLMLVVTNPPTIPPLMALVAKLRRATAVLLVHDVYPEVLVAVGIFKPRSLIIRVMNKVMSGTFASFQHVIALGADMQQLITERRRIDPANVSIIPNWGETGVIAEQDQAVSRIAAALGLTDKTVIQYSGNLGLTHDIELILDVARRLAHRDDIRFLFAGEGGKIPLVEAASAANPNILRLPRQAENDLSALLSCSTAFIIALPKEMTGISVPSRMYNIMAAARPIISVGDRMSSLSQVLIEHDAGWWCDSDGEALQRLIETIAEPTGHKLALAKGRRARLLAEQHFSRDAVISQFKLLMRTVR